MQPRKESITKKSRQRKAISSPPQNDLHTDIPYSCFKNGWHLKTTPNSEPLTQQKHAKLLNYNHKLLQPRDGTSLGGWSVSMSTKRNKWVSQTCAIFKSWELTQLTSECKVCQLLDPFVHQPCGTQNCWTLPELSVSSLLAPRLGLPNFWIFRLRNMWKYNDIMTTAVTVTTMIKSNSVVSAWNSFISAHLVCTLSKVEAQEENPAREDISSAPQQAVAHEWDQFQSVFVLPSSSGRKLASKDSLLQSPRIHTMSFLDQSADHDAP